MWAKAKEAMRCENFGSGCGRRAAKVEAVATHLPQATLVFDRSHVMKFFNDKLSGLRRDALAVAQTAGEPGPEALVARCSLSLLSRINEGDDGLLHADGLAQPKFNDSHQYCVRRCRFVPIWACGVRCMLTG